MARELGTSFIYNATNNISSKIPYIPGYKYNFFSSASEKQSKTKQSIDLITLGNHNLFWPEDNSVTDRLILLSFSSLPYPWTYPLAANLLPVVLQIVLGMKRVNLSSAIG